MRFSGVIFDLDGTLLDSLQDVADFANIVLGRYGFNKRELAEYRHLAGDGSKTLMQRASGSSDEELISKMALEFKAVYENEIGSSKPFDGVKEVLWALQKEGVKKAVLSNKPDALTKECVKRYFGEFSFEAVCGQTDEFGLKPNPASALFIASTFNATPEKIAFVGDTKTDMLTAVSGGFYPIGVTWGFRDKDELVSFGAKDVVLSPKELSEKLF